MIDQPAVILYDANGKAIAVTPGAAIPAGTSAPLAAGSDYAGTPFAHIIKVDASGQVYIGGIPLPPGAATETTLGLINAALAVIQASTAHLDVNLSTRTKPSDQQHAIVDSSALPSGAATDATVASLLTDTQLRASAVPVSVASVPLPTGAATEATLAAVKADTDHLDVNLSTVATQTTLAAVKTDTAHLDANLSTLATQTTAAAIKADTDHLDVNLSTVATQATLAQVKTDTDTIAAATDVALSTRAADATVAATNTSLGTDGNESPANGTGVRGWLRSIYDRLTAGLGRTWTLSSGTDSVTVSGTSTITGVVDQGTGGSSAWKVDGSGVTQPVSGPLTDAQLRATAVPVSNTNLDVALSTRTKPSDQQHAIVDSSALPTGAATESTLAAVKTDTDTIAAATDVALSTRASESTLSAAKTDLDTIASRLDVALSTRTKPADQQHAIVDSSALPTGAATDTTVAGVTTSLGTDGAGEAPANGTGVRGWLRSIFDKLSSSIAVTGTFWQATQPVSGTFFQATQPVSAASLPLPSGAATDSTVAGLLTDTQLRASAVPVSNTNLDVALSTRTKPSDQQHAIIDTSALPTGAATSAAQALELTQLQAINSLTPGVYDYISLGYTGTDLTTVVFKVGGASGTIVSTLTLAYSSDVLQSVTRT